MPFKTFVEDEVLKADDANRYFVQQTSVVKSSDETVTSSTTFQNDDELFVSVVANAQYFVEFFVIYDAVQAADIKIEWSAPTGSTFDWTHGGLGTSATGSTGSVSRNYRSLGDIGTIGGPSASGGALAIIPGEGRLVTSGTAGLFRFRWAQNSSNSNGTIVKANSVLIVQKLTV